MDEDEKDWTVSNDSQSTTVTSTSTPWWWWGGGRASSGTWKGDSYYRNNDNYNGAETSAAPTALIVVYWWIVAIFCILLRYGCKGVHNGYDRPVIYTLLVFSQMMIVVAILVQGLEDAVQTTGPLYDQYGFLGQVGVLLFGTCCLALLFALIFILIIRRRMALRNVTMIDIEPSDYEMHADVPPRHHHHHNRHSTLTSLHSSVTS